MEYKNETTLSAFVLSKATLEERFEIPNPEAEGEVKYQTRNGMTDDDLDAYVVALLITSANTQVIASESAIFGGSKIDPAVAWNQLVNTTVDHFTEQGGE
jgi:hypothetical protein